MAVMRIVGDARSLPAHARVIERPDQYIIELDVSDFTESELAVEALGPCLTVSGEQRRTDESDGLAFRLQERFEESFRLPDDAEPDRTTVFYKHGTLEIHAPRRRLATRRLPIEHPHLRVDHDAEPC